VSESYSIVKRDTKNQLLEDAQELRNSAEYMIAKLKSEGKSSLTSNLEEYNKLLIDLMTQLKNINPTTEVGKALLITMETSLKLARIVIVREIEKLSVHFYADDPKDELLKVNILSFNEDMFKTFNQLF